MVMIIAIPTMMKAFIVVYQGVVGEAVCGIPSHVRVVQHRRKKCQDRPHRQRHCVAGTPNFPSSVPFFLPPRALLELDMAVDMGSDHPAELQRRLGVRSQRSFLVRQWCYHSGQSSAPKPQPSPGGSQCFSEDKRLLLLFMNRCSCLVSWP